MIKLADSFSANGDHYLRHAVIEAMVGMDSEDLAQIAADEYSEYAQLCAVVALRRKQSPEVGSITRKAVRCSGLG